MDELNNELPTIAVSLKSATSLLGPSLSSGITMMETSLPTLNTSTINQTLSSSSCTPAATAISQVTTSSPILPPLLFIENCMLEVVHPPKKAKNFAIRNWLIANPDSMKADFKAYFKTLPLADQKAFNMQAKQASQTT
ncbi:hypothetical protein C0995_000483 [Termitomyces sp. Mi166|nr:hypothetical protein C0995_000483 [Termitomyces sp. Mi166\